MKPAFAAVLAFCFALSIQAQPASTSAGYFIDAQSPSGLRELFTPGETRLPLVSAHRGGAGPGLPENCMATFAATLRAGWALLEIDLRTTKDGVIVLLHDPTLDRTTTGKGAVKDRTFAELQELRLKDRAGNVTDFRIPTLDEALRWAKGKTILMLDKKEVPVKEVVRVISAHRAEAYAMMLAYSTAEAKECHAANPEIMMEVMLGTRERYDEFARSGVPWRNVIAFVGHTEKPNPELCQAIRGNGASTMAGTSRNLDRELLSGRVSSIEPLREKYRAVLAQAVDIIETDIPRELSVVVRDAPPPGAKAKFFRVAK